MGVGRPERFDVKCTKSLLKARYNSGAGTIYTYRVMKPCMGEWNGVFTIFLNLISVH